MDVFEPVQLALYLVGILSVLAGMLYPAFRRKRTDPKPAPKRGGVAPILEAEHAETDTEIRDMRRAADAPVGGDVVHGSDADTVAKLRDWAASDD